MTEYEAIAIELANRPEPKIAMGDVVRREDGAAWVEAWIQVDDVEILDYLTQQQAK